ncbi:transposable element Tcb2 transposase [Trichonephila clavipes]|uniref:Transposable element Tcb2 transposase n=1 Tax=Trichonephila clavipes TaxID=2585209 RepID=A0A8X6W139_TRICX|nr:transposable element Tcb2 transposase [Trichonephila clavipes]
MEAVWSARREACLIGRSHLTISSREDRHIIRHACIKPTALLAAVQIQAAPSIRAPLSIRSIPRCLAEGYLVSRRPLHVLSMSPTHRRLLLDWCRARGNWTEAEWNQVVFSDESRFNLSSDYNRVRVWRTRGECLNPDFTLQRHNSPTAGGMIWGDIAYDTRNEAYFWLHGYVNKQNCRIWNEANPQVYVETPLHPEKLTVWFALWVGGIILLLKR